MATVTICDVKSCGDIIKTDVFNTTIGSHKYQLCKKCHDGLLKFLDENLNKPDNKEPPIQKLIPTDLQKFLDQKSGDNKKDNIFYPGGIIYTGTPWITSSPQWPVTTTTIPVDITWSQTGTTSDVFKK